MQLEQNYWVRDWPLTPLSEGREFDILSSYVYSSRLFLNNNNTMKDEGGRLILEKLMINSSLTLLHMNNCGLKQKSFVQLAKLLTDSKSELTDVSVAQNELDGVVAYAIAEALKKNKFLKFVNFSANEHLGHHG